MQTGALEPFFACYLATWLLLCVIAVTLVARHPDKFSLTSATYRRFLLVRWKVATFLIAAIGITIIAPYTGDPMWDYVDASVMAVLTFASAPWSVGTLYLSIRGRATVVQAYVAACAWMFSASWSYDLYLLWRDGHYTDMWLVNIPASSILYLCAGLMWNLDWREGRGTTFSFVEPDWFQVQGGAKFMKLFWVALPFMIIVAGGMAMFFI